MTLLFYSTFARCYKVIVLSILSQLVGFHLDNKNSTKNPTCESGEENGTLTIHRFEITLFINNTSIRKLKSEDSILLRILLQLSIVQKCFFNQETYQQYNVFDKR